MRLNRTRHTGKLGIILVSQGQQERGIAEIRHAIADCVRVAGPHHHDLGSAYYSVGRYREAVNSFQRIVQLQPDSHWGYNMLGTAYHAMGDANAAISNYQKAISLGSAQGTRQSRHSPVRPWPVCRSGSPHRGGRKARTKVRPQAPQPPATRPARFGRERRRWLNTNWRPIGAREMKVNPVTRTTLRCLPSSRQARPFRRCDAVCETGTRSGATQPDVLYAEAIVRLGHDESMPRFWRHWKNR